MKSYISAIFIILLSAAYLFGTEFTYTYDDAGNRTMRQITAARKGANDEGKEEYKDAIAEHQISIFPNPARFNLE